jgi:predicted regulator of Ras-like GTPase activity (Roadblock/LC7/MglB family)
MMTRGIYGLLTGEEAQPTTLNDLLGFPTEQNLTLKDIMERISCWPDVTGCVLGQSNGLPIVGSLSPKVKLDKAAIVAFAPRMFEALNKSFAEMSGSQTDELIIPTSDTSFHILRKGDLYLIILAKAQQMPSRHLQVARLVLASLNFK